MPRSRSSRERRGIIFALCFRQLYTPSCIYDPMDWLTMRLLVMEVLCGSPDTLLQMLYARFGMSTVRTTHGNFIS